MQKPPTALAGILGVHFEDASTGTLSLALADPHKLPPSRIPDAFIQASFATGSVVYILPSHFILFWPGPPAHVCRLEVLNTEDTILLDQLTCFFVVKIAPLIANVSMKLAELLARFSASRRASLLACQPMLLLLQPLLRAAQMARIVDLLPGGEGGKMQQSQIQAHRFF